MWCSLFDKVEQHHKILQQRAGVLLVKCCYAQQLLLYFCQFKLGKQQRDRHARRENVDE